MGSRRGDASLHDSFVEMLGEGDGFLILNQK